MDFGLYDFVILMWVVGCGLRVMVCGLWFVVCGLWFMVCGLGCTQQEMRNLFFPKEKRQRSCIAVAHVPSCICTEGDWVGGGGVQATG